MEGSLRRTEASSTWRQPDRPLYRRGRMELEIIAVLIVESNRGSEISVYMQSGKKYDISTLPQTAPHDTHLTCTRHGRQVTIASRYGWRTTLEGADVMSR